MCGGLGGVQSGLARECPLIHQPEAVPPKSVTRVDRIRRKVREGGDSVPAPDLVYTIFFESSRGVMGKIISELLY